MNDFSAALSRAYDRLLEAEHSTEHSAEVQRKAMQIMRGLTDLDVTDALVDHAEEIRNLTIQGHEFQLGFVVRQAIQKWCEDVAVREIEA